VAAVAASSPAATPRLHDEADEVVRLAKPTGIGRVGSAYRELHQLDDLEALEFLQDQPEC
jgi:predicted phosphoribosyltransferase